MSVIGIVLPGRCEVNAYPSVYSNRIVLSGMTRVEWHVEFVSHFQV